MRPLPEDDERSAAGISLGRTLALSDGVFAIAMTLVAFQIKVPDLNSGQAFKLAGTLGNGGDSYFAYAITFAVIGMFWIAHHRIFRNIAYTDEPLMLLNLLLLMAVAALPFPSDISGRYGQVRAAVILYACSMIVVGMLLSALTVMAHKRQLLSPSASAAELRLGLWRSGSMVAVFLVSIPVALVSPSTAPFVWIATFALRFYNPFQKRGQAVTGQA